MDALSVVQKSITAILVLIAVTLVVGQLIGQPLLVGYVATGSMDPTLAVGDGFVAIPPVLAGGISTNDVITYEAQSIDGGGPTTHRVVGVTEEGYITQGDANAFTDQDAGEPPVNDAQILAVVLQINGDVVAIPSLGAAANAVQSVIRSATNLIGVGATGQIGVATTGFGVVLIAVTLLYGFVTSERQRTDDRSTRRSGVVSGRLIVAGLILIVVLPVMTSMVLPGGTTTAKLLSANPSVAGDNGRIAAGGSENITFSVENSQYLPKVVVIEPASSGLDVTDGIAAVSHGNSKQVTLTVTAPDETGTFSRSYSETHYLHVLPLPVIKLLHAIHPFIAMLTLSFVAALPVVAVYLSLFGLDSITLRQTHR
jgi:signal peptidase